MCAQFDRDPITFRDGIPVFSPTDDYAKNYERIANDHLDAERVTGQNPFIQEDLWLAMEDATADVIAHYSQDGNSILDIGVGTGRLLSRFPNLQRFGNDISFSYLNVAREKGIEVCYSRIEELPYTDNSFDLVVCTDVLEHVLDLYTACTQMIRVCKPGGTIIVRVPNQEDLTHYTNPAYPYKFVHLRTFDVASIHLLFERIHGLTIRDSIPCAFWPLRQRLYNLKPSSCDLLMHLFARVSKRIKAPWYSHLVRRLYRPIEIITALQKPC